MSKSKLHNCKKACICPPTCRKKIRVIINEEVARALNEAARLSTLIEEIKSDEK